MGPGKNNRIDDSDARKIDREPLSTTDAILDIVRLDNMLVDILI